MNEFPYGSRTKWLQSVRDKPGKHWASSNSWSYEGDVYGTFLSDDFWLGTNFRYSILDNIDNGLILKRVLFNKIWKNRREI